MDISQIRKLKPKLRNFLTRFDDCFPRKDTRGHLPTYVSGQLSDIPEKSVEPIAINAGVAPRTLQEFLSQHHWDRERLRDQLQCVLPAGLSESFWPSCYGGGPRPGGPRWARVSISS